MMYCFIHQLNLDNRQMGDELIEWITIVKMRL